MSDRFPSGVATTYNDGVLERIELIGRALWKLGRRIVGAPAAQPQAGLNAAERAAADHLRGRGCRILARNFRCRGGEIDLIVLDEGCVAFVEVRQRTNPGYGGAAASITPGKQARIRRAAHHWLAGPGKRHVRRPCRFDALLFEPSAPDLADWQKHAFDASD